MSDDAFANRWAIPPAHDDKTRERSAANQLSFQQRELKRSRAVKWGLTAWAVGATGMSFLLATSLTYALPLTHFIPVHLWHYADGTVDSSNNETSLPGTMVEADQKAWLWQYVKLRESYVYSEASDNYDVVSNMSSPSVRKDFQLYWNNKIPENPGPTLAMGKNGVIRIRFRDSVLDGDTFSVRYCRYVLQENQAPVVQPMISRLHFQVLTKLDPLQRIQYNPHALIVTSYPGAYPQGTGVGPSTECGAWKTE